MSKDIQFDEKQVWDWSNEKQPQQLVLKEEQKQKIKVEFQIVPFLPPQIEVHYSSEGSSSSAQKKTKTYKKYMMSFKELTIMMLSSFR